MAHFHTDPPAPPCDFDLLPARVVAKRVEAAAQQAQAERVAQAARAAYKVRCDAEAARMEAERRAKDAAEAEARQARAVAARERYSQPRQYGGGSAPAPAAGGQTITMEATAYCLTGRTATGAQVGPGTIAVDPSVIPLGSRVWVEGYGEAIAADTGGAIVGNIIDVWLPCGAAIDWGRRQVTVTIY